MTLHFSTENLVGCPDGGPLRVEVKGRGLDLGRDTHLDWTLPDPSRSISSKHCEIRFRDGGYWLHDVSTNGTFVNGGPYRLHAPYPLPGGARLSTWPYIISIAVPGGRPSPPGTASATAPPAAGPRWGAGRGAGPPP